MTCGTSRAARRLRIPTRASRVSAHGCDARHRAVGAAADPLRSNWLLRRSPAGPDELTIATCIVDAVPTIPPPKTSARAASRTTTRKRYEQPERIIDQGYRGKVRASAGLRSSIGRLPADRRRLRRLLDARACATRSRPTTRTSAATSCRSRRRSRAPSSGSPRTTRNSSRRARLCSSSSTPPTARIALEQAEAKLAKTVREVRGLFATTAQLKAAADMRAADVARATEDLNRRAAPRALRGRCPAKSCSMRAMRSTSAKAALVAAQQELAANQARIDRTDVANHPDVLAAAAAGSRRVSRRRAHAIARAGFGLRGQALGAARPARRARRAVDGDRSARPGVGGRELQGAPACVDARRVSQSR